MSTWTTATTALTVGTLVRKTAKGTDWYVVTAPYEMPWGGAPEKNPHTVIVSLAKTPNGKPGNAAYAVQTLLTKEG